mgnify:CR=1 FL=1
MNRNEIDEIFGSEATDENLIIMGRTWTIEDMQDYVETTGYEGDAAELLAWLRKFASQFVSTCVAKKDWDALAAEVISIAKTDTDGIEDWLSAGDYHGDETIESLAAEWDSLEDYS